MTAGLTRTQSRKFNKSRGDERGNSPGEGSNSHHSRNGVVQSVVIDITVAHPVIPPRISSLAWHDTESKGSSMASSTSAAAMDGDAMAPPNGHHDHEVGAGPPLPPLPLPPPSLPQTPRVWDVVTTEDTTADLGSTSNYSITIPMENTFFKSDNLIPKFPDTDALQPAAPPRKATPPPVSLPLVVTSRPSSGSSQVSLAPSHLSARSLAAGPSSLATSWASKGNVGNDCQAEGEVGLELEMNAEEGNMVRSSEVIDLVGEEGEEEQERAQELRQPPEEALILHTALPTPGMLGSRTGGESGKGGAVLEGGDHVAPPNDTVGEADIVDALWHPLSSDPLSDERDHSFDPDGDQINSPPVREVETRRRSVQFSESCSSETDEKKRPAECHRASLKLSASEKLEQLKLKLRSSEPWDLGLPPEDSNSRGLGGGVAFRVGDGDRDQEGNEHPSSDYYSTLNSKNFAVMQKSRQRPLVPHSSYYFGPPPPDSAYGTAPVGHIGVHHPREIVRIERDYTGGEVVQFMPVFPLELEGRITATQFLETINNINEILISAYSLRHSFVYNVMAVATLQLSTLVVTSHYTKEMRRLERKIDELNTQLYNPAGLNILWPRKVAFLFLEIEYY